ncbi:MAG: hypothetical protein DWQ44_08465 [Bacteroidetes bacterium]|nr:MAG: hypothetical protein DWQ33_01865 [Bacteroidota bacterium]REK06990.1 MAG: hypothetical protein DWQ39_02225 [Bacteroidota bacterium]REK33663.1 MAG: hypothetical protein DWQ44_08465 [Bacteroidota bacterium]REK48649.1 MAG: hypothetical protein DWQ48_09905 [Bacteroidota bacterium]
MSTLKHVICIGASLVDFNFNCFKNPVLNTSNPAAMSKSPGGVARNIAHHLSLLGCKVTLITCEADDAEGKWLKEINASAGIDTSLSCRESKTGVYASIHDHLGNFHIGVVSSDVEDKLNAEFLSGVLSRISEADLLIADCNLSVDSLKSLLDISEKRKWPVILDTVSVSKASRIISALPASVLMIKPNEDEFRQFATESESFYHEDEIFEFLHRKGVKNVWLSRGENDSILSIGSDSFSLSAPSANIIDTNGAGDAAVAGWAYAFLQGKNIRECLQFGHAAAGAILESQGSVRPDMSTKLLEDYVKKLK